MANNKYYYRAEIYFSDKSAILGNKYQNLTDCIPQFNHFINMHGQNMVVSARIQKRFSNNDKEFLPK